MPRFVDLHVLQTVPPSNVNRDDTGSPKSAVFGGVRRARVSSQAWKRAARAQYKPLLDDSDLGTRTKRAVQLLVERITTLDPAMDKAEAQTRANAVVLQLGIKLEKAESKTKQKARAAGDEVVEPTFETSQYLIFWSNRQLDRLARLAIDEDKPTKRAAKEAADSENGIEVALFGRMVADAADLNVDAAVQVAHAISTHAVDVEQDYFTAVDDENPESETGAGMIGTVDFNASTLYRYATVAVERLQANLGGDVEATGRAVEAFVRAFVSSMPTGKQNTFANRTVADAVVVVIRDDQPVNLVGAFEEAVRADGPHVRDSAVALARYLESTREFLGDVGVPVLVARSTEAASDLDRIGEVASLDDIVVRVGRAVRDGASPS